MKTVILYVLTGLVTGLFYFYDLMYMMWGAPLNRLDCIALAGSATLLAAAIIWIPWPRIGAKLGLAGSLLLWVRYAPGIFLAFAMPFST